MKKDSIQKETNPPWDGFNHLGPTRLVLDRIADKWSVSIVRRLSEGTLRFSQLRRAIIGTSQKALTSTLRGMERDGMVQRRLYGGVPPRVEYSLTALGRSLVKLVAGVCSWAEDHIEEVQAARQEFDSLDHGGASVEAVLPPLRRSQARSEAGKNA